MVPSSAQAISIRSLLLGGFCLCPSWLLEKVPGTVISSSKLNGFCLPSLKQKAVKGQFYGGTSLVFMILGLCGCRSGLGGVGGSVVLKLSLLHAQSWSSCFHRLTVGSLCYQVEITMLP